ncbi:Pathogenesis-related homeodomain protein [Euphorbia peplus]|nr:Pathogenesis-related homeodomain protein [Euphorbia peplus]
MGDARNKAAHHEPSKSSLSRLEYGSLLIASLKFNRKDRTLSRCKTHKPKSEVGAKMMKRKVSNTPRKGTGKCSTSRKAISRKIVRKALDKKTPKKLPSSGTQGKYSSVTVKRSRKKGKKGHKEKVELDEPARLQRRTRYLLIKMKHEQNYIDAYSGEGWKGQSREKIKPEKELLRAHKEILKCKLGIRDIICQLDSLSKVGCIEDSVIAPDGSVSHEHIFCAKCKSNEVNPDNDIILCDGTCNRGFHQKCLDPPLDTENIPPGDQGWYCDFCECRMEIIEAVNAHLGTHFSVSCCWQDIFKEAAVVPDGGNILLNPEEEWPSDDSEDSDYDPEGRENSMSGAGTGDDASGDASSSTSLGWSSDGEVFSGSRKCQMKNADLTNQSIYSSLDSDESSDGEIMYGRRQRRAVDYRKLHDEMFGKDGSAHEQFSEDEDWGPGKRKRRVKESDAASTLMTLYESEKKCKKVETVEVKRRLSRDTQVRRSFFRIPPSAVEKLRQVFAENELPSRTVKEKLSRELDLEPGKVSKWFKNARYMALKLRKEDGSKELNTSNPLTCLSSRIEGMKSTTGVLVEIKPTSLENRIHSPKDLKHLRQKKNLHSSRSSKENELKKISMESPSGSNEMNVEDNDDVSLKKLLKPKPSRGKKISKSISTTEYETAEAEMERLCRVKDRLENMKKTLTGVQNRKAKKPNSNHLRHEESVVFVPIAELKEKFS